MKRSSSASLAFVVTCCLPIACSAAPPAPMPMHAGATTPIGPFVASRDRAFGEQMMETMTRMDDGMSKAPMTGDPDHDFVAMMIPHHQGGIDMAKVLLVHGEDPEMRRLAQAIITDQQNEIELMRLSYARRVGVAERAK